MPFTSDAITLGAFEVNGTTGTIRVPIVAAVRIVRAHAINDCLVGALTNDNIKVYILYTPYKALRLTP